jgi:phosphate-selective porin OprO/OprP
VTALRLTALVAVMAGHARGEDQPVDTPAELAKKLALETRPGGYVHFDTRRFLGDSDANEMSVRRLRFRLDGSAAKHFRYRTLIDFAGSRVVVNDAWAEAAILPELQIRAGKDKSQFGLERLQSATQLTFIERAYPTQLAPNRDIGVWLRGDLGKGLVHYAAGIVDGVADNAVVEGESDNEVEYNLHLLVSPFARHAHLGDLAIGAATTFGRTRGTPSNPGITNVRSVGQALIARFASGMDAASTAVADGYRTRYTAHGYYYRGPIGLLAEYVRDREPVLLGDSHRLLEHTAWQVASSVALTPGDRPAYASIRPRRPLDPQKGAWGAVELAARYTELRLDRDAFDAGIMKPATSVERARESTLGANWYFNDYLRLQLDYSFTRFTSVDPAMRPPDEHLIATRLQASI